jgi:hypothetical protein
MSQYLRSCWFGRRVHPVGMCVSLWSAYSAWLILAGSAFGRTLDGPLGIGIGLWQATAAALLWAGWWAHQRALLIAGLLWAAGGIAAVSGTIIAETARLDPSAIFGAIMAGLAAWSWQLEREDPTGGHR